MEEGCQNIGSKKCFKIYCKRQENIATCRKNKSSMIYGKNHEIIKSGTNVLKELCIFYNLKENIYNKRIEQYKDGKDMRIMTEKRLKDINMLQGE